MKIYRNDIQLVDIELDDSSVFKHTIMGDEMCVLSFTNDSPIDFKIGDYIEYEEQKYTINTIPSLKKIANNEYSYNITFEGIKYDLNKILLKLDGKVEFPVNFSIEQVLDLVLENINEVSTIEWVKGTCSITPFADFQVTNENCLEFLNKTCLQFGVEFEVIPSETTYIINIRDVIGIYEGVSLSYKKGIYNIDRKPINDNNIITKLYVSGAAKNIPSNYGSNRLKINPLEKNVGIYGISEKAIIFENVFPKFEGTVVVKESSTSFLDNTIDFNLNLYLLPGIAPKCVMLSGDLAGYSFDILHYSDYTKIITIGEIKDDIGQELPNSNLELKVGDKYTLVDIYMPTAYVENAESELSNLGNDYLDKYSEPLVKFTITIDARYLEENNIIINVGQKINLIMNDFSISEILRVYSLTRSLANPYHYTMELTDNLQTSRMLRLLYGQYDINKRLEAYKKELRIIKNN